MFLKVVFIIMKKKMQRLSINTYSLFLLLAVLSLFFILISLNGRTALRLLLNRIYRNTRDTVELYQKQIDSELDRIETYLYMVTIENANYSSLLYQEANSTAWYSSLYHLDRDFLSSLSIYTADGFLLYYPENDTFLMTRQSRGSGIDLRNSLREIISNEEYPTDWEIVELDGSWYMLRTIHMPTARLGAYVSVDALLGSVTNAYPDDVALYLTTPDNRLFGRKSAPISLHTEILTDSYKISHIGGQKMLIVQQPLTNNDLYLTRLIPYSEIQAMNTSLIRDFVLTTGAFLVLCLLFVYFVKKRIIQPVANLTKALEKVSEGDLENQISTTGQLIEYEKMSEAFNGMVREIRNLKIDIYEEKLQRQELEIQYLKQQITPHFMINCLNTAYQLTEAEHLDLARSMLTDLSRHLRYTLSSGLVVPLCEELQMVKNYVDMSGIRYPGCLALFIGCPDIFLQASVVPLLILNFIENTVKYEVVMGKMLEMHVDITSHETEDRIWLHICIWDTGKGFSEKMLLRLTDPTYPDHADISHIGITNVILRLRSIFPETRFSFSNRTHAGAQIDIDFPYQPQEDPAG